METCSLCGSETEGKSHTICAKCGSLFCSECTDKNIDQCPKCGYEG